jgi:hypothetical protein
VKKADINTHKTPATNPVGTRSRQIEQEKRERLVRVLSFNTVAILQPDNKANEITTSTCANKSSIYTASKTSAINHTPTQPPPLSPLPSPGKKLQAPGR